MQDYTRVVLKELQLVRVAIRFLFSTRIGCQAVSYDDNVAVHVDDNLMSISC